MPSTSAASGSRRRLALFASAALLLPLAADLEGGRYLGSGDTVPAELLPIALLEHGTLTFDAFAPEGSLLPYWFRRVNGRVLSNYPILPGLLNVPVYAGARLAGISLYRERYRLSLLTAAVLASFSVLFLFFALRRICRSDGVAFGFALLYAFATEVWSVAGHGLFQHGPSLFFLTLAIWLLLEDRPRATALAGLALGLAVINRPTNIAIAAPLAFFVLRRRRAGLPAFAALAGVPAVLNAVYAWAYWGSPFSWAYWGSPFSLAQELFGRSPFSADPAAGLAGLLVSPARGLFVFSPMFLFAIPAGVAAFRRSGALFDRCLVAAILLELTLCSRWRNWWGGHSFGYRLLIELCAPLVLLIARFWPEVARSRAARSIFAVFAVLSISIQFLGAREYPSDFNAEIDREPERLWQARGSEIPRLARKLLADAGLAAAPTSAPTPYAQRLPAAPMPRPRWSTADADDETIPGFLESPRPNAVVHGLLRVAGWAVSPDGPVEVQVILSPGDRVIPVARSPRPDVCRVFPALRDCGTAGFRADLATGSPHSRENVLLVELRTGKGRVRRLGPIRFFWPRDVDLHEKMLD